MVLEPAPYTDALLQAMLVDFRVISREDLTGVPDAARAGLAAILRLFLRVAGVAGVAAPRTPS